MAYTNLAGSRAIPREDGYAKAREAAERSDLILFVTDSDLNTVAEGPVIAIHQPDAVLEAMDEWNTTHHTRSGLVERVKASDYDEQRAARETIASTKASGSKTSSSSSCSPVPT